MAKTVLQVRLNGVAFYMNTETSSPDTGHRTPEQVSLVQDRKLRARQIRLDSGGIDGWSGVVGSRRRQRTDKGV